MGRDFSPVRQDCFFQWQVHLTQHRMPHTHLHYVDLAGHERYLKTTLYGLTSGAPSCVILMIGANAGVIGMSKEHLAIALALNVPVVICITKVKG